jgi:hypothetical protein
MNELGGEALLDLKPTLIDKIVTQEMVQGKLRMEEAPCYAQSRFRITRRRGPCPPSQTS